ncbi:hypothetical protein HAX54_023331 [Datura stramonium]|uniref:Uncharacterized protein n=1 Tax=Datura stramonium TaxID=4076 RepID=A0ABS8UXV9_DATST|nr:hypothetical protein [Datura stramonium]
MFSSMTDLESLDLSHSGLSWSGSSKHNVTLPPLWQLSLAFCHVKVFPDFLLNAKELGSLDMSGNEIQGQLPKWVDQGVFSLDVLDLSQNYLTNLDHIPWQSIKHKISASVPVLSEEDEPSFLSEMTWQSVLIGYACGLTSVFAILYLI